MYIHMCFVLAVSTNDHQIDDGLGGCLEERLRPDLALILSDPTSREYSMPASSSLKLCVSTVTGLGDERVV